MLGLDVASKRQRTRADYPYVLDYRLRWNDNDVFGHMNNPVYGVLCDSVANEFLVRRCGYRMDRSAQAAIIAHTHFDYFGSVAYPGVVEVGLRVARLGRTSVVYEVGVFVPGEDGVKAVGGSMHVWVHNDGGVLGRPSKEGMPPEVRRGYESLMESEVLERTREEEEGRQKGEKSVGERPKAKL